MPNEIEVKGFTNPKFEKIKDDFMENFKEFNEVGASFTVFLENKENKELGYIV